MFHKALITSSIRYPYHGKLGFMKPLSYISSIRYPYRGKLGFMISLSQVVFIILIVVN
jgi:hypothetical protein